MLDISILFPRELGELLLRTYELLLKSPRRGGVVKDSFVYQWIIEGLDLIKATDVAVTKCC